jgi:hypothetical protein
MLFSFFNTFLKTIKQQFGMVLDQPKRKKARLLKNIMPHFIFSNPWLGPLEQFLVYFCRISFVRNLVAKKN